MVRTNMNLRKLLDFLVQIQLQLPPQFASECQQGIEFLTVLVSLSGANDRYLPGGMLSQPRATVCSIKEK